VGHSVLRKLLGAQQQANNPPLSRTPSKPGQKDDSVNLLEVLRQNLEEGSQPPAAILHATAEAARILSGADGLALALRTKGVIVCRARSGDPTPELGAPLSIDSGISGECVRSATILVCDDTATDPRVDPEVCRVMGIQSIVVVPLRGPVGIAGILEAFSTRARAFGEEQINSLRALAEVAEAAYQRECGSLPRSAFDTSKSSPRRTVLTSDPTREGIAEIQPSDHPSLARRYWVLGIAVTAVLLVAGVWLSGREPAPEAAAKEPPAPVHSIAAEAHLATPATVPISKPKAGITRPERSSESAGGSFAGGSLKNAAQIESDKEPQPAESAASAAPSAQPVEVTPVPASSAAANPDATLDPPSVTIAALEERGPLAGLGIASNTLPTLEAKVSQGVTRGVLIHRVDPVYPLQAIKAHIGGNVTLEITIAEDGRIREVKKISGSPVLAEAASDAVRRWRYSPSLLNDKPVEVQVQITVVFKLPGGNND
jgi:TonB family protein